MNYSSSSRTARVGQLQKKSTKYDVWSLGEEDTAEDSLIGGEELKGLSCLLPRSRKNGQLYSGEHMLSNLFLICLLMRAYSSETCHASSGVISICCVTFFRASGRW